MIVLRSSFSAISTHTPLAGRDPIESPLLMFVRISTHTPLAGRDIIRLGHLYIMLLFLLTRPLRDVTYLQREVDYYRDISTHTPLAGRDGCGFFGADGCQHFYSHAPCGT